MPHPPDNIIAQNERTTLCDDLEDSQARQKTKRGLAQVLRTKVRGIIMVNRWFSGKSRDLMDTRKEMGRELYSKSVHSDIPEDACEHAQPIGQKTSMMMMRTASLNHVFTNGKSKLDIHSKSQSFRLYQN